MVLGDQIRLLLAPEPSANRISFSITTGCITQTPPLGARLWNRLSIPAMSDSTKVLVAATSVSSASLLNTPKGCPAPVPCKNAQSSYQRIASAKSCRSSASNAGPAS